MQTKQFRISFAFRRYKYDPFFIEIKRRVERLNKEIIMSKR